jgi:uncharacterized protein (DUF1697 family)
LNKYIALLRGINVSGQKKIKMTELKLLFEHLGFEKVETYIQSGNVVFAASKIDPTVIVKKISSGIKKEFGFDVQIMVINDGEIKRTIKNNPFIKSKKDVDKLYVTFLSDVPFEENIKKLKLVDYNPEEYFIDGKKIYLYVPSGYGKAKLNNNFFENKLKVSGSTRNWKTIIKLNEMINE